jgi:glycine cleavage system H protein
MAPANLRYSPTHEWAGLEGAVVRVGITDFAVSEIKDIVYVDLPAVGTRTVAGESFGAIETVKAAFDLYAPVTGTIKAANGPIASAPETVAKDPFGAGWMVEIAVADPAAAQAELGKLLDATAYAAHCAAQHKH